MGNAPRHIGWIIERRPEYNALVREMYPIDKIQKENDMILAAGLESRRKGSQFNMSSVKATIII